VVKVLIRLEARLHTNIRFTFERAPYVRFTDFHQPRNLSTTRRSVPFPAQNCPFSRGTDFHLTRGFLGPADTASHMASISSVVFAQLTADSPYTLQWVPLLPKLPFPTGDLDPIYNTWFLGSSQLSFPNGILIGSAVFAHLTAECPYTLQLAIPSPSKLPPPVVGSGYPSNTRFLGPSESSAQTAFRAVSRFCRAHYCDRPTDRPRYSVGNSRPLRIRSTAMRPNNNNKAHKLCSTTMAGLPSCFNM